MMDRTQVELELQVAREWARQGNLERTILHIDLAEYYLLEKDKKRQTVQEAADERRMYESMRDIKPR